MRISHVTKTDRWRSDPQICRSDPLRILSCPVAERSSDRPVNSINSGDGATSRVKVVVNETLACAAKRDVRWNINRELESVVSK